MKRDLIVQSTNEGLDIALLEDDKLVEFHQDIANKEYNIGDIYLGEVKKVISGLNATFVDIGHEKNAFLHYHDLGPNFLNFNSFVKATLHSRISDNKISNHSNYGYIPKNGEIGNVLKVSQTLVVQLVKEPISTKGHRITTEITLAGRYLILIPFGDALSISRRIVDRQERSRLQEIMKAIKPDNFGIIARTVAENIQSPLLEKDLQSLMERWDSLVQNLNNRNQKLLGEFNKSTSILRDMLNETFSSIKVDNKETFIEFQSYIEKIYPEKKRILKLYKDKTSLFEVFNIEKQLKSSFGKIVNFGKGAYLVIEHTEAMHVIDVNSGSRNSSKNNREENVLNVNLEAAGEIVRQIRLRDIGGIIVIDFIDMRISGNRKELFERMKVLLKNDPTQSSILPISKFGLMEVTRHRVKPAIKLSIAESCPVCKGSGQLKPTILVMDDIEHSINYVANELKERFIRLKVHPFIKSYMKSGFISRRIKWIWKYKMWIKITSSNAYHLIQYKILDRNGKNLEEF